MNANRILSLLKNSFQTNGPIETQKNSIRSRNKYSFQTILQGNASQKNTPWLAATKGIHYMHAEELANKNNQTLPTPTARGTLSDFPALQENTKQGVQSSSISLIDFSVFIISFLCYFLSSNLSLEDYDSINFAMAVNNFDLSIDAPHPPGAPIFIAWVKLTNAIISDIPLSLILISALSGALFVAIWHGIFRQILTDRTALVGTIILACSPGLWMTASRPMSDTFAAAVLSAALLMAIKYSGFRHPRNLIITSALLSVTVGIRPQFGIFVPFLLVATLFYFKPNRDVVIKSILIFSLANAAWLIPTIVSQYNLDGHGWMTYFNQIARFKESFDTASGSPLLANNVLWSEVLFRAFTHLGTLGYFSLGLNMWYPASVGQLLESLGTTLNPWPSERQEWTLTGTLYTLIYVFGSLALIPRIKYYWNRVTKVSEPIGYLVLLAISYTLVVVMLVPPHTRFYIPLLPLFILPPLMGLQSRRWGHKFQYILALVAIGAAVPTIADSVRTDAPPIALVKEIQQQSNSDGEHTVLLLNANAARHASWYLEKATIFGTHHRVAPSDPADVFADGVRVFANYPNAFPGDRVQEHEIAHYHRPYRVWMRHTSSPLYELTLSPVAAKETTLLDAALVAEVSKQHSASVVE